jgi:hypothetical protein
MNKEVGVIRLSKSSMALLMLLSAVPALVVPQVVSARLVWFLDGAVLEAPGEGEYELCGTYGCGPGDTGWLEYQIDFTIEYQVQDTGEYLGADTERWVGASPVPDPRQTPSENEVLARQATNAMGAAAGREIAQNAAANLAGGVTSGVANTGGTVFNRVASWGAGFLGSIAGRLAAG